MHRLILVLLAIVALAVAACSGPADSSPSTVASVEASSPASEEATASEEASPSEEASEEESESAEASGSEIVLPSFELPNSAPELAAILPDQVGDIEIPAEFRVSMDGAEFMATGGADESFQEFLTSVGADADDISVAFSGGSSEDESETIGLFAFRVAGVGQDELLSEFQAVTEAEAEGSVEWEESSLGGKDVVTSAALQEDVEEGEVAYLYVRDDIIFIVSASSDELAEDALSQLP